MTEYNEETYISYKLAQRRFNNRYGSRVMFAIRFVCYSFLVVIVGYIALYLLSVNDNLGGIIIPMNGAVVTLFVLLFAMADLPVLFPYVKGFRLPGFGIDLKEQKKK